MTTRKYRSHAEWLSIIQHYKDSSLTPAEFCQQQNLDYKYFLKRKRSLESQVNVDLQSSAFVKVHVQDAKPIIASTELILQYQNMQLHITTGTDVQWLAQLMEALS